jgi:DmsE family decaheme c-type cytochrome
MRSAEMKSVVPEQTRRSCRARWIILAAGGVLPTIVAGITMAASTREGASHDDGSPVVEVEGAHATGAPASPKPCLSCHDTKRMRAVDRTPHGRKSDRRTPAARNECEACHGPGAEHAADPESIAPIRFTRTTTTLVSEQNAACLACHESGSLMSWEVGQHASASVSCADCHSIHEPPDPVTVKKSQARVCYTCHLEKRAKGRARSRHPVLEGLVSCSDCHNVHGTTANALLVEPTVNETCFLCHADKRGPYLYEHAPSAENCAICHDAHGSNQLDLLVQRPPFLCQQCHNEGFHPSELYDGGGLPMNGQSMSTKLGKLAGRSCMNCHPRVHGSNHPSGNALSR